MDLRWSSDCRVLLRRRKDTSSIYTTLFQYLNVIFCMWRWLKCTHSKRSLKLAFEFHLSTVKHNVDLSSSLSYCRRDVTVKMVPADTLLQKMPEENRWSTHIESITSSSAILLFSELANTWSRGAYISLQISSRISLQTVSNCGPYFSQLQRQLMCYSHSCSMCSDAEA